MLTYISSASQRCDLLSRAPSCKSPSLLKMYKAYIKRGLTTGNTISLDLDTITLSKHLPLWYSCLAQSLRTQDPQQTACVKILDLYYCYYLSHHLIS